MSEEKVIQHAHKAVHAIAKKEKTWWGRIKEFLGEIIIIVIAVSITLWFHNWNDHVHERKIEKEFLIGTRNDLKVTAERLDTDIMHYQHTIDYYDTISAQMSENRVDKKFMDDNSGNLTNMLGFEFDNSRFESFKSSGYLRLIENQKLLQDITKLYGVTLPDRQASDLIVFTERRNQYVQYIGSKVPTGPQGNSIVSDFINDPAVRFQIIWQRNMVHEIRDQKVKLIPEIQNVIKEIDEELKDNFGYDSNETNNDETIF
ncbi:MAG: hypothetical protein JO072_01185 [Parafilimonas sp.]|nr:hypothetical protein [Parafilimonas sp.]